MWILPNASAVIQMVRRHDRPVSRPKVVSSTSRAPAAAREITLGDHAEALHAHERLCLQRRRHARAEEFNGAHQRRVR